MENGSPDFETLLTRCRANLQQGQDPFAGLSVQETQAVRTRYASFADEKDPAEFVIASEVVLRSLHTPRPYLHLMASNHDRPREQWASFWDQHCGGFSCVASAMAGKMSSHNDTNYVPTSPTMPDRRNFYLHEKGQSWPLFPVAGYEEREYSGFECRLGLDRFTLACERNGLASRLTVWVHPEYPVEVWRVTLVNRSRTRRDLSWFSRLRINLDSYPPYYFDPRVVCEGRKEETALIFLNHDKNNKHPRSAFFAAQPEFCAFDMMGEAFDGFSPVVPIPAAVQKGRCGNTAGLQPHTGLVAAVQFKTGLEPGQESSWVAVFGKCPEDEAARRNYLARIKTEVLDQEQAALAGLERIWNRKILSNAIHTPDWDLNRYFNVWSKYQSRNQARFTRALDKVGYRDVVQDLYAVCDFEPSYVRQQLASALQYQFADGRAIRGFEKFKGGGHDLRMYHDSPSWIPDTLTRYIKETGDFAFLDERLPYLDPATLQPSLTDSGTVYEHACRGIRTLFDNTGYHGLCAIGYGDWNDAISAIGGQKGVSVWLSCAGVYAAGLMAELADRLGRTEDRDAFRRTAADMTARINQHAWDGAWYVYAFNGQGVPIGSARNAEGKMHLNVNTWALFSGVAAAAGRQGQVWKALENLATPVGHMLLRPPYTLQSRADVGRIADQLPGMFENGSIYTHGEAFYLFALLCAGQTDRWYKEIFKTLPSNLVPDIASGPPHQQSNFAVGPDHPQYGTNLYSNFTGSLPWYRRGIEMSIGVLADYDGLRICPKPPSAWERYSVKRTFRGRRFILDFRKGAEPRISLNGNTIGDRISVDGLDAAAEHRVEVVYVAGKGKN